MIKLRQVSLQRGTKVLLEHADLDIFPQHKVAVIGPNGCGKSSFFALIQAKLSADDGDIHVSKDWSIVAVEQEVNAGHASAIDYTISGNHRLVELRDKLNHSEQLSGEEIAHLHEQLSIHGHYEVESKAAIILAGLGFSTEQLTQPVREFSGGWQMRLNLARALLCPSDLLLLDEPTNHLDLDAIVWLEEFLQAYQGTLILISHDQSFIDNTVNEIVSFEDKKLVLYKGAYSAYEKQKAQRLQLAQAEYEKQQQKRQHLESFVNRFKAKASKAKQAQSRIKQLEKMQDLLPVRQSSAFNFAFVKPEKLPNPLISMEKLKIGYHNEAILNDIKFNLVPGSRIGLLGKNGAGKSTFMKFLAGRLAPLEGDVIRSSGLNIGYFTQYQVDALDLDDTPLQHIQRLSMKVTEQYIRDYLGGFGFHGDQALASIGNMSGGEKSRLVLATLVWQKPNLLLLDEPTNHLDIEVRHALSFALQSFEGAMVVVSHDRYLLESVCDDFYLVDDKRVEVFAGDLLDYKKWILQADKPLKKSPTEASDDKANNERKLQRQREAAMRQRLSPLKKQVDKAEKHMEKVSNELSMLELELADPSIYDADKKSELKRLLDQQRELKQQLAYAEDEWMSLSEELEQMQLSLEA